ncbi:hypothetical protein ABIE67_004107 [Streptomyces sp. V4I8]|uniref:hypothetical protein n=1 Tax=Streptomyces sp. V4I8 TaxID=3156469 RepID=UPI003512612D
MRAGRARARVADNEPERLEALAEAVRLGCVGLERCAPTTALRHLWTRRLLEAAKHQAFELPTDEERSAMVDLVMDILTGSYGPVPTWGLPVSLTVARFLRSVHRRHADPTLRLDGANAAMALLQPYDEVLVQQAETGDTGGLLELRFDLEREYQRLRAAHQQVRGKAGQSVDYGPAWAVLDRAKSSWPLDTELQLARARLHRYLWEYTEVVENLESVIRNTRSGQERRQAQIEMAEALLSHVRYGSLDPSDREAALERAAAQLDEPLNHRFQSERVIVMRERIRLESGAPVDQERVDAAFEKLISTDYTTRIGRYLHSRRYSPVEPTAQARRSNRPTSSRTSRSGSTTTSPTPTSSTDSGSSVCDRPSCGVPRAPRTRGRKPPRQHGGHTTASTRAGSCWRHDSAGNTPSPLQAG